jgi:hypothetical protein
MQASSTKLLLAAGLAAGLIAAGCGGDDSDEEATAKNEEAITQSEYIASSNAICERTQSQTDEPYQRIVGEGRPTPAEAQRFLAEAVLPAMRENVSGREALTAPAGDETEVEAMIAAGKQAIAGFEQVAADRSKTVALFRGELRDPATEYDSLSRAYGIDSCGGDE